MRDCPRFIIFSLQQRSDSADVNTDVALGRAVLYQVAALVLQPLHGASAIRKAHAKPVTPRKHTEKCNQRTLVQGALEVCAGMPARMSPARVMPIRTLLSQAGLGLGLGIARSILVQRSTAPPLTCTRPTCAARLALLACRAPSTSCQTSPRG